MKKTLKLFGLVALSAFVFSCTKEADTQNNNDKPETTVEESGQPRTPAGQESSNCLLSFGADIVSPFDTKAVIDLENKTVSFEAETDKVLVVNGADNKTYFYNGSSFEAESEPVSLEGTIYAYYPASAYSVDAEGNVTFTMPEYLGSLEDIGDKAPMAGVIAKDEDGDDYKASFKNVASILEVGITGNRQLSSVVLTANQTIGNGSAFSIGWNGEDPTMDFGEGATKSVTVNTNAQLYDTEPTKFYFIVPAGVDLTGVNVNANLKSADAGGFKYFYLDRGDWNATRNKIYKMSFYAGLFSGGAGTEEDPYKIANARDFKHISQYCKNGYGSIAAADFLTAKYQQTKDISFGTESRPGNISAYLIAGVVGDEVTAFSGTYNGKYSGVQYTLSNFTVNGTPTQYDIDSDGSDDDVEGIALFKRVVDAKLQNIAISNAVIYGGKFTAGLAGYASGSKLQIEGCSISGSELSSSVEFGVGGLVGGIYGGSVTSCSAADLTIEDSSAGKSNYGGLICYINGTVAVSDCTLGSGKIEFKGAQKCGGIVGQSNNNNITISNCVNNSTIVSNKNYLGGIVGFLRAGTLKGCGNIGNISGTAAVGGLVGDVGENGTNTPKAYGVITDKCYNTGKITGTGNNVGGIAGVVFAGRIEKCRNSGIISSTGSNVGGIVAQLKVGDINACYSGYNNNIEGASCVGGIVGLLYPITYKTDANRWLGGTKVINCQSSSYIISTGTDNSGAAGCIVGWARQESGNWGIVIANCTNWGAEGRVKSTNTGSQNLCLGGIVGRLNGGNWAIVDNCFSYTTINAIQINGANPAGTAKAPFQNVGPVFGYKAGTYATIRDCFYRSGWNNSSYLGKIGSTGYENVVQIKVNDNVGKGTATQEFNLYSGKNATYPAGTLTLLEALNRSAHNIEDASTFKNYQTNVNTSNIAYEGWAQPTSGGWLVPAALFNLGTEFYKK